MSIVQLNNIYKKYNNKNILENFSLNIESGEFISIMGESGKGKSTILNIIGLIESYDSGELIIDGHCNIKCNSRESSKILREKIAYLFQNFALIDEKTVTDNLMIPLKYVKKNTKEKLIEINNALEFVGLKSFEKRKVYELSGGEQQRVAIARILLKPCKIILADEPTGSLDEKNRDVILNLLCELNKMGKTIIVVTHDKKVAEKSKRIIYL